MSSTTPLDSKKRIGQGEIYYIISENDVYDPHEFKAGRPAVVISNDMICEMGGMIEVVFLTRHPQGNLPTQVKIMSTGRESWALCDIATPISRRRFGKYVNQCSPDEMQRIFDAHALSIAEDIRDIDKKDIIKILENWQENLENNYFEDMPSDDLSENIGTSLYDKPNETVKPDETAVITDMTIAKTISQENQITGNIDAITKAVEMETLKITMERDMYKMAYDALLNKILTK